jgi:hypothetical protein
MASAFRLELVVTRRTVPDDDFDDALDKLRDVKAFAENCGYVQHFAIAISDDADEKEKSN